MEMNKLDLAEGGFYVSGPGMPPGHVGPPVHGGPPQGPPAPHVNPAFFQQGGPPPHQGPPPPHGYGGPPPASQVRGWPCNTRVSASSTFYLPFPILVHNNPNSSF